MTQPAKAQEPSMEEILASIRRIIADDDATRTQPPQPPQPPQSVTPPAAEPQRDPPPQPAAAAPGAGVPAGTATRQAEIDAMLARLSTPLQGGPAAREEREPDVLDLTEAMATSPAPAPAASGFRTIDGEPDVVFEDPAAEHRETAQPAAESQPAESPRAADADRQLISANTSAAIDSAFNTLAQTVLVQNARTLEDLVREMLRPMLKTWLDDNLPGLVERLIRAEIERVSRGR